MSRVLLHMIILLFAVANTASFSTWFFVAPIAVVCTFAASRNSNVNFDVIDMFWLLFQLSFVAAPVSILSEYEYSFLFSSGVLVPYSGGEKMLVYRQDQVALLYFLLFVVALINAVILPKTHRYWGSKNIHLTTGLLPLCCALILSFALEVILKGGFTNIFAARYFKVAGSGGLFTILVSSTTLVLALLVTLRVKTTRSPWRYSALCVALSCLFVLYNPLNAARFQLIQALLPVAVICLPMLLRFKTMSLILVFGLVVVMPILSLTTRFGLDAELTDLTFSAGGALGFLDQHKNLLHLIDMVERDGYQFGSSTLSVVLFFIPRALWEGKPIVLALAIGGELFADGFVGTDNLSGPIVGDFYYDFGLIGVLIGSILTAYAFRKLIQNAHMVNGVPVLGIIFLSALPILFRGSVGAVIGPVFFLLVFYYGWLFLLTRLTVIPRSLKSVTPIERRAGDEIVS